MSAGPSPREEERLLALLSAEMRSLHVTRAEDEQPPKKPRQNTCIICGAEIKSGQYSVYCPKDKPAEG